MRKLKAVYFTQEYANFYFQAKVLVACEFDDGSMKGVVMSEPTVIASEKDHDGFFKKIYELLANHSFDLNANKIKQYLKRRDEWLASQPK